MSDLTMSVMVGRWFDHDEPVLLRTEVEINRMIDRLQVAPCHHRHASLWIHDPSSPSLSATQGATMQVGVTGAVGSIYFGSNRAGADYQPGSWYSLENINAPEGDIAYLAGDGDSEYFYPANSVISIDAIRRAIHEFASTQERPTSISWQDWRPPLIETLSSEEANSEGDPWADIR